MSLLDALLLDPAPLDIWVAYRTDGIRGSGTVTDPYDGSTQALFDEVMGEFVASLPEEVAVHVHLGPTPSELVEEELVPIPYETEGFWMTAAGEEEEDFGGAWQPRPNMKITGSGIDVTVLKLVGASTTGRHYFAIGSRTTTQMDYFEVSDLTIDAGLPDDQAVNCGAIRVMGNHVRIGRVKCIGWGSRTSAQPGFVIALIVGDPDPGTDVDSADDTGIEDCIAVNPSANNNSSGGSVSILHIGGRDKEEIHLTEFGRGPYIRNCFIDCADPDPANKPVYRGLSMGACRGGIVEGNQVHNIQYGGPHQGMVNTGEIIVRNNTYRNVLRGPIWYPDGEVAVRFEHVLVEGNSIQLVANATPSETPIGIQIFSAPDPSNRAIIRNNTVRYVDSEAGEFTGYAINVSGVENLIVEDNLVEVFPEHPIRNEYCGQVKYFNNQTFGGRLILGWDSVLGVNYDELATDVEDAFVLAMLEQ